ncbi:MAG: lipid-A-disaccharide synthase, partial [Planctomycetaceae bacterium]|nr:lipid-A-disaccharide synthase [Planctomycetaceae bacterium]
MEIFFSVGEPSGDQHAAHLIEELTRRRPDIQCSGYGGPEMEQAGCRLDYRLTELAVMGIAAVLPLLGKFIRLAREARQLFRERKPDAVVLVDFPGFNWWIARAAKKEGIPVFYFLPPQLWAWAGWRIRRIRKHVDHVLCGLPFEPEWYAQRGVQVEYVGHPFFDEVRARQLDADFCREYTDDSRPVLGVLPGSRNSEVNFVFPLMLESLRKIHQEHPTARLVVACYREQHVTRCREMAAEIAPGLPLEFHAGKTPEIIEVADCCVMCSGSVSLEMLARGKPAVVMYRIGRVMHSIFRPMVRVPHISLSNLIAGRRLMPEFYAVWWKGPTVRRTAEVLNRWLADPAELANVRRQVEEVRDM